MLGYHYCSEKEGPPGKEVPDVSLRGNNPPTVGRRYTDVESKKDPLGRKFMMYPSKGKINPLWEEDTLMSRVRRTPWEGSS